MPTKDPHIALIDARQQLDEIKQLVRHTLRKLHNDDPKRPLTPDEQLMVKAIRQQAIDAARAVQDRLYEELESHARQTRAAHD